MKETTQLHQIKETTQLDEMKATQLQSCLGPQSGLCLLIQFIRGGHVLQVLSQVDPELVFLAVFRELP